MKNVGIWILTILLTLLMSIYIVELSVEDVVSGMFTNSWKSIVSLNPFKAPNEKDLEEVGKKIQGFLDGLLPDDDSEEDESIEDTVSDFIEKGKGKISEITGFDFSEEGMEEIIHSIKERDFSQVFDKVEKFAESKLSPKQKMTLKVLKFLTNHFIRKILLGCMILTLIGIAFLQLSFYKWIKSLAISMTASGALVSFFSIWLENFLKSVFSISSISTKGMFQLSTKVCAIGVSILVVYFILILLFRKKDKGEEE